MTTTRRRGICACGNPTTSNGIVAGRRTYKSVCTSCHRESAHRKFKKSTCEMCGFIPQWLGQLDVDHIDGDHCNNAVENLQTLCANCHRLKTWRQQCVRDHVPLAKRRRSETA